MVKPPSLTGLMPKLGTQGCRQRGRKRSREAEGGGREGALPTRGGCCPKPSALRLRYAVRIQIVQKSQRQRRMCARIGTHTQAHTHTQTGTHTPAHTHSTRHTHRYTFYFIIPALSFILLYFTSCCFFSVLFQRILRYIFPCSRCCCLYFSHLEAPLSPRTKQKATPAQDQRISVCEPVALSRHRQCFALSNDLCVAPAAAVIMWPPYHHPLPKPLPPSLPTLCAPPCAPTRRALSVAYFAGRCNCFANFKYRA